mmetsp:Transcript_10743/g.17528  ORF Transcript_10743/g.17528 Transcript_10743/m.17528 type:complete len:300 (+) Transcript_10743:102-1001(+)
MGFTLFPTRLGLVIVVFCCVFKVALALRIPSITSLSMTTNSVNRFDSFKSALVSKSIAGMKYAAILGTSAFLSSAMIAPGLVQPAAAVSLESVNSKLASYDLPPFLYVPPGFSPLVSEFGRGNIREKMTNPILVQFAHPNTWVVQTTSVNNNGEAGTVSANDYMKGDSAYLFVAPLPPGESLSASNKPLIEKYVLKALSQKGDPVESLKIYQIQEGAKDKDGKPYVLVDFGYQLNTEAGFLIGRRAVLSLTSKGEGYLQGLVAVSTDKRWRQSMEPTLRDIANSFRVYRLSSGIFSADN